ncbi:hypothetical protein [Paenibacillus sp. SN-8-1]|uniref:hypothetical protein n=1 Tax=Paenibacillus sp. SN-8-1 TaxID=3435409 RepID=UPI003D9AAB78
MKYVNKVALGLLYIGLSFSVGFGIFAVADAILDENNPVYTRIITAAIAVVLFVIGYTGGGDSPGEETDAA